MTLRDRPKWSRAERRQWVRDARDLAAALRDDATRRTGARILPGEVAFKLSDTHGLPVEVIRMECERRGIVLDEWGLRCEMYAAGWNVPAPGWEWPERAEV